jgi:prolyl oligopeptidase
MVSANIGSSAIPASGQSLSYPVTRKSDQVDNYHGTEVADPYRWLEDDKSAETSAWVKAENEVTFAYLNKIPCRAQVKNRLQELYNYTKYSAPFRRGDAYFFFKNDGLQNQSVLYCQNGMDGAPEMLLDPNKFSEDGTSRLGIFAISKDGRFLAYGISSGGSDWQDLRVMEIASRKVLPDDLKWIKVSAPTSIPLCSSTSASRQNTDRSWAKYRSGSRMSPCSIAPMSHRSSPNEIPISDHLRWSQS